VSGVAVAMDANRKYVVIEGHRYVVHKEGDCEYVVVHGAKYELVEVPEGVCIEDGSSCPYPHGLDCIECSRHVKRSCTKKG
jgi:hypothetical protein